MEERRQRILAVASGKGGVGKTVVTANLALALAQHVRSSGATVVAVDLDLGCGNLNTCLGVRSPTGTINDFLLGKASSLQAVLSPTEQPNLQLISCAYSGLTEVPVDDAGKQAFFDELPRLDADYVLLDLGAGTSVDVLDFFLGATERIIVVTPESLSLHNAFLFLKSALLHCLTRELEREKFLNSIRSKLHDALADSENLNITKISEDLKQWDRWSSYILSGLVDDLKVRFIVNMYRGGAEKTHLTRFHNLLFKYLSLRSNIDYLGFIHYDDNVRASLRSIKAFQLRYPKSRAARDIEEVSKRLVSGKSYLPVPPLPFPKVRWWERLLGK